MTDMDTITFNVFTKGQSTNPDGSTQYVTTLVSTDDDCVGTLTINTNDSDLDGFYVIDGDFTASVAPS
jgi:hypothetical protein